MYVLCLHEGCFGRHDTIRFLYSLYILRDITYMCLIII